MHDQLSLVETPERLQTKRTKRNHEFPIFYISYYYIHFLPNSWFKTSITIQQVQAQQRAGLVEGEVPRVQHEAVEGAEHHPEEAAR